MNKHLKVFSLFTIVSCMSLVGCSCSEAAPTDFDFTISLQSGKKAMLKGDTDQVVIFGNGNENGSETFTYLSSDPAVLTVSDSGAVSAVGEGRCSITVTEVNSNITSELSGIEVYAPEGNANGGFNYASSSGEAAVAKRTEILGKLEKYVMDSHLTGISLFENGGYVKYQDRINLPTQNYITGYGFGILSEGKITKDLPGEKVPQYQRYLHSASASNPSTINAYNNDGSEVSDLHGYISSSYWGTKMNDLKNGYVWYPILANANDPIRNEEENATGLYRKWKVPVKTGAVDGVQYRSLSSLNTEYEGRNIELEDYEFIYKALLTGACKMSRGAQMAADQSYGLKGALQYYNATKTVKSWAAAKDIWKKMQDTGKLGFKLNTTENALEFEFINPIDQFTAKYSLSSNLTSPMPESFISKVGGGDVIAGMKAYGSWNSGSDMLRYVLNVGPFMLEKWDKGQQIIFKRNDDWFEVGESRYLIEGVKIRIVEAAQKDPDALYNLFGNGELDSCGIPIRHIEEEVGKPGVKATKGDSTFKLNVNSCSQERWDELFGPNGKIHKNANWNVKPWMSNDDFLDGLFYSINRKEFATKRGVNPSINYFADAYMSDPQNGVSYNDTAAHKQAVAAYQVVDGEGNDMFGYDKSKAISCFKAAVNSLVKAGKINYGTAENPTTMEFNIEWMYESEKTEYGEDIIHYFEDAFNDPAVCGNRIKLVVNQSANTDWQQVYTHMRQGEFDLAFGAISGNTLAPLNFLEVLKSDNSSGFTLNWGADTSKVDTTNYLIYDNHLWSFDALWAAADHGCVVSDGKAAKSVQKAYIDSLKNTSGTAASSLGDGGTATVKVEFINVDNVALNVDSVSLYLANYGIWDDGVSITIDGNTATIALNKATADAINAQIKESNNKTSDPEGTDYLKLANYGTLWSFDLYYNLRIGGGAASQSYEPIAKNRDSANQNS